MVEISRRLRHALVGDLVANEDDAEEVDSLIHSPLKDEREVTGHLGRQLGVSIDGPGDVHATLLTLVPELRRMLSQWPLPEDGKPAGILAEHACKNLNDYEVYATFLSGPAKWRKVNVGADCAIEKLPERLRPILLRAFTSSLNEMLGQWTKWNVPTLEQQWVEAKHKREETEREARLAARAAMTAEERQRARGDKAKVYGGIFQPRGRTT